MQLHSKTRFIAAQFSAVLKHDLWLKTAGHANRMARMLANEAAKIPGIRITQEVQGNEVFAIIPRDKITKLQSECFFYIWDENASEVRGSAPSTRQKVILSNSSIYSEQKSVERMPHQLIQTEDGSITLYVPELNEHYHSVHGAIQESIHIFIRAGLDFYLTSPEHRPPTEVPLSILEAGFGTGLNAYLSLLRSEELQLPLDYHSVEKISVTARRSKSSSLSGSTSRCRSRIIRHAARRPLDCGEQITPLFHLHKYRTDFRSIQFQARFDIVYFDCAFNRKWQPQTLGHSGSRIQAKPFAPKHMKTGRNPW